MQKAIASILLVALMGQTFNQGWSYLGYLIQKKEYMKRCVNKARPKMHCDGKCQLMKQIAEREKREQGQSPEMKYAGKAEVLSSRSSFLININIPLPNRQPSFFVFDSGVPVDRSSSIFHPPPVG